MRPRPLVRPQETVRSTRCCWQTGTQSLLCYGPETTGHATALIIATIGADAEYFAVHELGFVTVSATILVSDSVYVGYATE